MTWPQGIGWLAAWLAGCLAGVLLALHETPSPAATVSPVDRTTLGIDRTTLGFDAEIGWTTTTDPNGW